MTKTHWRQVSWVCFIGQHGWCRTTPSPCGHCWPLVLARLNERAVPAFLARTNSSDLARRQGHKVLPLEHVAASDVTFGFGIALLDFVVVRLRKSARRLEPGQASNARRGSSGVADGCGENHAPEARDQYPPHVYPCASPMFVRHQPSPPPPRMIAPQRPSWWRRQRKRPGG
jgi:hypothetical protein